jgi:hypothetical protein
MAQAWVDNLNYNGLITGKWDADTNIQFLLLSETTQKRLPGAPQPSSPCAVKEIICRRLLFLFLLASSKSGNPTACANSDTTSTNSDITSQIVNTLNLQLLIIRHAFPSYNKVILPIQAPSMPERINVTVKGTQQQLLDMIAWIDKNQQANNNTCVSYLQRQTQRCAAHVDKYFE